MKYNKADDILPEALLKEVQKYASGRLLYVPKAAERKAWGEASGARAYYAARNAEIRGRYAQKATLEGLAEVYGLSVDTVRKIVFGQERESAE